MKKRKQIISNILIIGTCLFTNLIYGQKSGYYYFYEFEQFLMTHTIDSELYKKEFSDNLRYLAICRENNQEGDLEFLVFHHGEGEFEIIQKKQREHKYFEDAVNIAFEKAKGKLRGEMKEKFMTIIRIRFDIEPLEENHEFEYDFIRTAPKPKWDTDTSHDWKRGFFVSS